MSPKYRIEIEFDGEVWVVRFPELAGCSARSGNVHDALDLAEHAQDEYLLRWAEAAQWGEIY